MKGDKYHENNKQLFNANPNHRNSDYLLNAAGS